MRTSSIGGPSTWVYRWHLITMVVSGGILMASDASVSEQQETVDRGGNGLAIAGLVCGIVGLVVFNIVLGPLAIIFGSIGLSRARHGAPRKGMSIAALVLGIVDVVILVALIAAASAHGGHSYFHVG